VEFQLAGQGADGDKLRALARELGLDNVCFLGQTDRVAELLAEANLFVLPSRWEGMPTVVLEAMAARCPVVATRAVGTTDLVTDGVNGLLVPVDDVHALAGAMARVLDDADLATGLVEEGWKTALAHSNRVMVATHDKLYTGLASDKRNRR